MKENTGCLARALYSNTPEAPNELLFRKGDVLTIIEYDYEGQSGWWLCSHRGQRGICPSNYLELLDDKYAMPIYSNGSSISLQRSLSHSSGSAPSSESALVGGRRDPKEGEGNDNNLRSEFDPLETYDFPRSSSQLQQRQSGSQVKEEDSSRVYANDEPLYENELPPPQDSPITKTSVFDLYDVPKSYLPVYGQSIARLRKYGPDPPANPISEEASLASPIQIGSRSIKSSHCNSINHNSNREALDRSVSCDLGLPPTGTRNYSRTLPRGSSQNSINQRGVSTDSSISQTSGGIQDNLFQQPQPPSYKGNNKWRHQSNSSSSSSSSTLPRSTHFNTNSNRLSIQSESADSGIEGMVSTFPNVSAAASSQSQMTDLYDVPRSAKSVPPQQSSVSLENGSLSRPQSSLSISSSGVGLSIANSDSKDSLDNMYDVPRSVKSYVNHMETKYDQVVQNSSGGGGGGGINGRMSRDSLPGPRHSRHNSASSIFSAYGYTRKQSGGSVDRAAAALLSAGRSSSASLNTPGNELYDVPRSCPPPTLPRQSSIAGSSVSVASGVSSRNHNHHNRDAMSVSQVSLRSGVSGRTSQNSEECVGMDYDVPSSFAKKVSLCDSTETLSVQDTFEEMNELRLGASSSSISSCSSRNLRSVSQCNNFGGGGSGSGAETSCNGSSEVKILPLGPKAAVSVCEKLRHEVVTSIGSILDLVKPKWRSKENLTSIMADLRFSCIRLSLAIKDMADFASRSMSNVKKLGDEVLLTKLHRLLTPVMNGSQIIQRDVDELEAYFWSVDRLSVSSGSQEKNISGDALDQLILCARSLKHDVTEISNFLALNSSALFREDEPATITATAVLPKAETKVEDTQEDYDYVSLMPMSGGGGGGGGSSSKDNTANARAPSPPPHQPQPQLTSRDEQLLEFYAAQIATTAPTLSQSIATFISAIQQNEPPESFNVHLKYVILMAYKMLFAGDTVHRNLKYVPVKAEIEKKANDLHKSILALYEASKVATTEFPKIGPMQTIVDRVWCTTQAATQLKKVIFNASCATL